MQAGTLTFGNSRAVFAGLAPHQNSARGPRGLAEDSYTESWSCSLARQGPTNIDNEFKSKVAALSMLSKHRACYFGAL